MSPRKRTPDKQSTETTTAVAELPTAETSIAVADVPAPEIPVAVAEPPEPESNANGQSFAERVGQRKWVPVPDPFQLAVDNVAGVRLFESKQDGQMAIKFGEGRSEDKPSEAVLDVMRNAGYHWDWSDRIWAHPVLPESAISTHVEAKRLFKDVCQMIRQEKSIQPQPDLPF